MTYEEALRYWFGRINYEQKAPNMADLRLDRMFDLLERLGNPHHQLKIVHIAGSKGKGSTAAMLASVLRHGGLRTGLFTSPHLVDVEERIQVSGKNMPREALAPLMTRIATAVTEVDQANPQRIGVTFFEIITALAMLYFLEEKVDIVVMEVGLGGRLDATNVCQPLLTIITSISLDHTQQLGNTLEQIAAEKAGIIKPGIPLICGVVEQGPQLVIHEIARTKNAPIFQYGDVLTSTYQTGKIESQQLIRPQVSVQTQQRIWENLSLPMFGAHQGINAALMIAAIELLREQGFVVDDAAVTIGLSETRWPARFEIVGQNPWTILDCAHTPTSIAAFLATLNALWPVGTTKRHIIFASSKDKDVRGMLALLANACDHLYLTQYLTNPRAVTAERLVQLLPEKCPANVTVCQTPQLAWQTAQHQAQAHEIIAITGSVFLAGELRSEIVPA